MGNYDKTFDTLCRVCLQHDPAENMVSLFKNSSGNHKTDFSYYGESLQKFIKVPVQQNKYFPTQICKLCAQTLEELVNFLVRLETSEKRLTELIAFSLKQDLSGEIVKEVICQYTLFCQYFPEESRPTSDCASTSNFEDETDILSDDQNINIDSRNSFVEVDIKVQTDSNNDKPEDKEDITQNDSDNIDMFLDTIESLVMTKIKQEKKPKKVKNTAKEQKPKAPKIVNFTCNICNRTLANRATYKNHMQRHGICRYICEHCGKGYPKRTEMTHHQLYQHGIGPSLSCDHCPFKAAASIELIEHIRLHTGERPFTCEKCGLNFRRKAIYRNHLKCHDEKTVSCNFCPRKFYRRDDMLAHSNNVHDRMYLFLCRICKATYAQAKSVRKHMLLKHEIPREMQGKVIRINKGSDSKMFKKTGSSDNRI